MEELNVMRKCEIEARIICEGARWSDFLFPKQTFKDLCRYFYQSQKTCDCGNQFMKVEVTSDRVAQGVKNHDEDKDGGDIKFLLRPRSRRVI